MENSELTNECGYLYVEGFTDFRFNGEEFICQYRRHRRCEFDPWVGKLSWRRAWQPTPVFLLGESHGQRSLAGYSPCGPKQSDTTEQLCTCVHVHTHTHTQSFGKSTEIMSNSRKRE